MDRGAPSGLIRGRVIAIEIMDLNGRMAALFLSHPAGVAICERNGNKTVPAVFRDGHFAPRSFTIL
jgi:hypothetical protein